LGSLFAELGIRKFKKVIPSYFAPFGYSGTKLGIIGFFQSGDEWVLQYYRHIGPSKLSIKPVDLTWKHEEALPGYEMWNGMMEQTCKNV
jgi:hypothetical protein